MPKSSNLLSVLFINIRCIVSGYRGQNCEINIDDCPGHNCQNGGTCIDGLNSYTCECPPTFTGEFCGSDVDECAMRYVLFFCQ